MYKKYKNGENKKGHPQWMSNFYKYILTIKLST